MNRKTITLILILAIVVLAACGRDRENVADTPTVAPTAAPAATEESAPDADADVAEPAAEEETPTAEAPVEEATAAPEQEESPLDAPDSPLAGPDSPLAGPDSPLAEPEPPALEAVTSAETGALIGRITVSNESGERPVVNTKVALAEVIRDEDGTARVAGYKPASAAYTASDELGRFALNELEPGVYTIILDAVITSVMLGDPVTTETIMVEIEPGKVVDIGRLDYQTLGLPGYID